MSTDAELRQIVDAIPAIARRAVAVPTKFFGTVISFDPGSGLADVTVDGDAQPVSVRVAVAGGVAIAQRVVIDFYPPHGALVTGVLGGVGGDVSLLVGYGQTFHHTGALTATESDIHYVPFPRVTRLLTGGVTVYGSGTVTADLKKNGAAIGDTLTITAAGMFTAEIDTIWAAGDAMTVEITDPGTGCSGLVVTEVP